MKHPHEEPLLLADLFCDLEKALENHCEDEVECEHLSQVADRFIERYKVQMGDTMYHRQITGLEDAIHGS